MKDPLIYLGKTERQKARKILRELRVHIHLKDNMMTRVAATILRRGMALWFQRPISF
jgi:hypothetical protein